ncbi:MAG: RDD family protein [Acidobacteriota bacterium]
MEIGEPNTEPSHGPPAWQTDLAERVQEYRQRRAHLNKNKKNSQETLEFDFDSPSSAKEKTRPSVIEFPSAEELERRSRNLPQEHPDPPSAPVDILEFAPEDEGDEAEPIARAKTKRQAETGPLEIELGPSTGTSSEGIGEAENSGMPIAPLASRFAAGIIDVLILLVGAAIFALIFWKTGGRFSSRPVELAAGGLIGVFLLFLYFAGCTAISSATPGLIWAGLEVRTFEGNPPELLECFWRAFGYLVSGSALMLGFVWSVVDADRLTWHDRMSGTFLTPARRQ